MPLLLTTGAAIQLDYASPISDRPAINGRGGRSTVYSHRMPLLVELDRLHIYPIVITDGL